MIERIVENWLTKANEKLFQYPFCQILSQKGHTILHLTRHCSMEQGKDIISIDKDGNICAFQLKGVDSERMTMSKWDEIIPQITKLVYQAPIHPSIKSSNPHKPFLVINSGLDEEVQSSITAFNQDLKKQGRKEELQVIVKGEILKDLLEIGSDFWPIQPTNVNSFLELYLEDGKGFPNKEEISRLFISTFSLDNKEKEALSDNQSHRLLLSTAIMNSLLLTPFSKQNNYAAEFEGLVLYLSHLLCFAEKNKLNNKIWQDIFNLSERHLYNLLTNLCEELSTLEYYHSAYNNEGECLTYRPRITYLISLLSLLYIWNHLVPDKDYIIHDYDAFIIKFINNNKRYMLYWGEYASPQYLLFYLFERITNGGANIDFILHDLIKAISMYSKMKDAIFTDPYVSYDEYAELLYSHKKELKDLRYNGESFSIESFTHLFAQKNYKNAMRFLWPDISKIQHHKFIFKDISEFYLWRAKSGNTEYKIPPLQQSWKELFKLSQEVSGNELPVYIKEYPIFYLCFLIVYPHRMNSSGCRWLMSKLHQMKN